MLGSLRKVWPFKNGETNILPDDLSMETVLTVVLALFGFLVVLVIEKFAEKLENEKNKEID
jgi:uncharacterized membrane protein